MGVRIVMDNINDMEKSINTAFASARMEGFQITPQIESDCRKIVSGELSISEYIRQVIETDAAKKQVS